MSDKLKDYVLDEKNGLTILAIDGKGDIVSHLSFNKDFANKNIDTRKTYLNLGLRRFQSELEERLGMVKVVYKKISKSDSQ